MSASGAPQPWSENKRSAVRIGILVAFVLLWEVVGIFVLTAWPGMALLILFDPLIQLLWGLDRPPSQTLGWGVIGVAVGITLWWPLALIVPYSAAALLGMRGRAFARVVAAGTLAGTVAVVLLCYNSVRT